MTHKHEIEMVQGSIEYLYMDVRADRVLDAQPVAISISTTRTPVVWVTAEWVGTAGKFRSARILLDGSLVEDLYYVYGRVTDSPETPVFPVGTLKIV